MLCRTLVTQVWRNESERAKKFIISKKKKKGKRKIKQNREIEKSRNRTKNRIEFEGAV
jgi:hypothetical protein